MKPIHLIVFLSVVLTVYGSVNWVVFIKGWKALANTGYQTFFSWTYWIIALTFIAGMTLERTNPGTAFSSTVSMIGSVWLAVFLYLLLFVFTINIFQLIHWMIPAFPGTWITEVATPVRIFAGVIIASLLIVAVGLINARNPRIVEIPLSFKKQSSTAQNLTVVMASDVHLGAIIGKKRAERLVSSINAQNPDLVVFAGDLVDHNPVPVIKENMGKVFEQIKSKFGVYAITGNHEYIGDAATSVNYFSAHGIKYIRDSVVTIPGIINLIGRDDRDKTRFSGEPRASIENLVKMTNSSLPTILLDHQPYEYKEAEQNSIDLMLSGHTHKGQLWPLSYITNAMFENHYGLLQKGKTYFYTSCGYGTWGPPVRIGNRPELVVFHLNFTE